MEDPRRFPEGFANAPTCSAGRPPARASARVVAEDLHGLDGAVERGAVLAAPDLEEPVRERQVVPGDCYGVRLFASLHAQHLALRQRELMLSGSVRCLHTRHLAFCQRGIVIFDA